MLIKTNSPYLYYLLLKLMDIPQLLKNDGIITDDECQKIEKYEATKLFSVHWELRTILYAGILLLTSGIGILVYKNIDTIGHQVVLAAIALACIGCFYYCFKNKVSYNNELVENPSPLFDYIALLGSLLFGTFIGYFQYQYHLFGNNIWAATLVTGIVFLAGAYLFDHKGLLSLGITSLASSIGLSITPLQILQSNNFDSKPLTFSALVFGLGLAVMAKVGERERIKAHFGFTYNNFAINLLFCASLACLFMYDWKPFSFLLIAVICAYYIKQAIDNQLFYFMLLSVIYTYIAVTYAIFDFIFYMNWAETAFGLGFYYFFATCGGVVYFLIEHKRILNKFYKIKK